MVVKGTIFHHKNFLFKNGEIGSKLLFLLNTPGKHDPYLFVKTTSQKKDKPSTPGCIENRSLFFIPTKTTFFEEPTWIQLYEIYEIASSDAENDPHLTIVGSLDTKKTDEIINCLLVVQADDITPSHKKLLKPPLITSIQKLKDKWGRY